MPEEQKKPEPKITLEFTPSEVFQLHLCVVCRSATATVKWTNAGSEQEQGFAQKEIEYLTALTHKLEDALKSVEIPKEETK